MNRFEKYSETRVKGHCKWHHMLERIQLPIKFNNHYGYSLYWTF